ncbi:MAG: helix-turn-helix domain-containing protein [Flavobacteriales bacterium]|nr:helix-turn-helix domain-containing protein [Flavobacteriales bacterium]
MIHLRLTKQLKPNPMELYPNLRLLRLQHNYKQEYVADALGMSQPEYSKMESGHRKMDAVIVRELSKLYDVPIEVILQQSASKSARPGNAYVRDVPHAAVDSRGKPDSSQIPRELLDKMMYNYTYLLENYIQQQGVQEELLRQLIRDHPKKNDHTKPSDMAEPA